MVRVPAKLVGGAGNILAVAAQIEGLAEEQPVQPQIGHGLADLGAFAIGEGGHAQGVRQAKALVHFQIGPGLAAVPGPRAGISGGVEGLAPGLPGSRLLAPR